ncbi:MAG: hypothetical protein JXD18_05560 [Anaerolineae bacterium]|nr:hypothetical protein [Anaerolineae bacterium]
MEYSLGLCLLDFLPNLAFLVGAYFLVRTAQLVQGRRCTRLMMAGALLVFLGGTLKAVWKLLYTTGVGDLRICSEAQFVLLAPGFLGLLLSTIMLARRGRSDAATGSPIVLGMAAWKIPFLIVMTLCSIGAYGVLTTIAFRRGARLAGALFIVAVLCLFAMSGMASGEQTVARQWIEEGINSAGQIAFAAGSFLLYRSYRSEGTEVTCA